MAQGAAPHYRSAMCNLYNQSRTVDEIRRMFDKMQLPLALPEGAPNLAPRDIAITDPGVIVRAAPTDGFELLVRRWSWPGPGGKPVYNFRSDGREFPNGRCLILADGFYEFTKPADPKSKRKDRWMFSDPEGGMLGIAGLVRDDPGRAEAYTMLTTEPGPDVAPYHGRQVAVVAPGNWAAWLGHEVKASELLGPCPAGSLVVQPAPR
jgi:putative SOS response-associated peptidase YedK